MDEGVWVNSIITEGLFLFCGDNHMNRTYFDRISVIHILKLVYPDCIEIIDWPMYLAIYRRR